MKICVFSDSHGYADGMTAVIGIEKPDMVFFLGDGVRDIQKIIDSHPDLPIYGVNGNCDFMPIFSNSLVCDVGGVTIFAAHGHMYNVKYEPFLDTLTSMALEEGAGVALFGHTHQQHVSYNRGVLLVNPGSIGQGIYSCYAVLNIVNGFCTADLRAI